MSRIGLRSLLMTICVWLCVSLLPSLAAAREDYCITPGTRQIDQRATAAYREFARTSNLAFMRVLNGVWLSVTPSPATNQVSYLYESFDTRGFYGYTNIVCTSQNTFCRRYDGIGLYAVRAQGNGRFFGAKIVSDLSRDHACLSLGGHFLNLNVFTSPNGRLLYRRVR